MYPSRKVTTRGNSQGLAVDIAGSGADGLAFEGYRGSITEAVGAAGGHELVHYGIRCDGAEIDGVVGDCGVLDGSRQTTVIPWNGRRETVVHVW